jgi:hypothetical protein
MKRVLSLILIVGLLATAGCARVAPAERQVLTGGAIGAASGAAIGAIAGDSAAVGAVVGGLTGVLAGALWDESDRTWRGY